MMREAICRNQTKFGMCKWGWGYSSCSARALDVRDSELDERDGDTQRYQTMHGARCTTTAKHSATQSE
jgi:hypothetical protein